MAVLLWATCFSASAITADEDPWRCLEEGLYLGEFDAPQKSDLGDSIITVVKIDPKFFSLALYCAKEHGDARLTAKQWCKQFRLTAAVNAGMFQTDGLTSVGYMKNFAHLNNTYLNKHNTVLAFNRITDEVPEVQIIDRRCQDFEQLRNKYNTLVQSIRMISCRQENVWSRQPKKWSTVAIGMDKHGNVLLLFSRSPYSVHDFINILLDLPISIYNAMYLEGGPEASLCLSAGGLEIERFGSFETSFFESDDNSIAWPIPNVIGIVKKQ